MGVHNIRRIKTKEKNFDAAFMEIANKLNPKDAELTLLFFHPGFDLKAAEPFLKSLGKNVVACSTAGEIASEGYEESAIVGVSFSGKEFAAQLIPFEHLKGIDGSSLSEIALAASDASMDAESIREKMGKNAKSLSILLIDGLCGREEIVTGCIFDALKNIPLVGGSSGDGLKFEKTQVYAGGKILESGGALLILTTTVPFEIFKIQHFAESQEKLVITQSDPQNRIVYEIDGEPAAERYAKILGKKSSELSSKDYSQNPLMLKIKGEYYIRSIQKANADGSLTFYCAIEDGLVLALAEKKDFFANTKEAFEKLKANFHSVDCSLFFECILRRLEVLDFSPENQKKVFGLYQEMQPIGFHTYGEQLDSLHINQTLTGVVFGTNG